MTKKTKYTQLCAIQVFYKYMNIVRNSKKVTQPTITLRLSAILSQADLIK